MDSEASGVRKLSNIHQCDAHSTTSTTEQDSGEDKPGKDHLRTSRDIKGISILERLPIEILEIIFLFCPEISLPRSSPYIAAKLCSRHVYETFFTTVFCYVKNAKGQVWSLHPNAPARESRQLVLARRRALKLRWMRWPVFKHLYWSILENERQRLKHVFSRGSSDLNRSFFIHGLTIYFGKTCHIPLKLLRLPMHDDQCKLLQALHHLGVGLDPGDSLRDEVLFELWEHGVRNNNVPLVSFTMKSGSNMKPSLNAISKAFVESKCSIAMLRYIAYSSGFEGRTEFRRFYESLTPAAMAELTRRTKYSSEDQTTMFDDSLKQTLLKLGELNGRQYVRIKDSHDIELDVFRSLHPRKKA